MKKSDLYRGWAKVLDMCEGTNVKPENCWSYAGINLGESAPSLDGRDLYKYEFAVAILKGKPVFVGDKVYSGGVEYIVNYDESRGVFGQRINDCRLWRSFDSAEFSWTTQKKTFMLNDAELPCPTKDAISKSRLTIHCLFDDIKNEVEYFEFKGSFDAKKVLDAVSEILNKNTK